MFEHIIGPIHFLTSRSFDSNIGFIACRDHKVLIDTGTGLFYSNLVTHLKSLEVTLADISDIVLTHSHIDHIGGVVPILDETSPRIHLHKIEADMINSGDMTLTLADTFGAEIPALTIDRILNEGDKINFGDIKLTVIHTPGHSAGSICLHEEELGVLFTGDTMFPGGSFGRVDFPTGDAGKLVNSLKRISEMEFQIALPGHMGAVRHNAKRAAESSYRMAQMMFRM